jgi:hypothetical protein
VRAVILRALAPYATADGTVRLVNSFRYLVAAPHRQVGHEKGDAEME